MILYFPFRMFYAMPVKSVNRELALKSMFTDNWDCSNNTKCSPNINLCEMFRYEIC